MLVTVQRRTLISLLRNGQKTKMHSNLSTVDVTADGKSLSARLGQTTAEDIEDGIQQVWINVVGPCVS